MSTPKRRRTISPYKVVRSEDDSNNWWVLTPDDGDYVEVDYYGTKNEAMDAAVRLRAEHPNGLWA